MRRPLLIIASLCVMILLPAAAEAQVSRTGTVTGTVTDPDGAPLPGVTLTLASDVLVTGTLVQVSNANGVFRFPSLPPGTYTLEATLTGFNSQQQNEIRLFQGVTREIQFSMVVGVAETITVVGAAPLVDVRGSSSATSHMDEDFIQALPSDRSLEGLLDFVPGSVSNAVMGGTQNGTQWNVDGINSNDPEGGEGTVFLDFDNIAEVSFSGVGGAAQNGGYSGIVVSAITKSGSNQLSGAANFFYVGDGFNAQNSDDPNFQFETNNNRNWHVDLGGPIARDTAWAYGSFRRSVSNEKVSEPGAEAGFGKSNTAMAKLTWQIGENDRLQTNLVWEKFDARDPSDQFTQPEAVFAVFEKNIDWNLDYLHVFSANTFLDFKVSIRDNEGADFPGSSTLPAGHEDIVTGVLSESPGWFFDKFRNRYQGNAALTHYADDFIGGTHDFKAGVSYDVAYPKTAFGLTGSPAAFYFDYDGEPFERIDYQSTTIDPKGSTFAFYVQDSWTLSNGRLTINPGLRFNHWTGESKGIRGPCCDGLGVPGPVGGFEFTPGWGIAPRLGFSYDLFGDGTTALKAHYGKYYEQLIAGMYGAFNSFPGIEERFSIYEDGEWIVEDVVFSSTGTPIDPNIDMVNFTELSVSVERQLSNDLVFEVTGQWRKTNDFMDRVRLNGRWNVVTVFDADGNPYEVYDLVSEDAEFIQTNPDQLGTDPIPNGPFTQERKYWGITATIEKRFADNWQLMGSYVYSQARGTDDTEFENGRGSSLGPSSLWTNPNQRFFAYGPMSHDVPHQFKVSGSVILPWGINTGAFYRGALPERTERHQSIRRTAWLETL